METGRSPATVKAISISPGSRVLDVSSSIPLSNGNGRTADGSIWKRLRDAGFDEESIRRRDKAALIAYIAKLEAEIYDLQHNMGLLIMERKDYASKFEEARLAAESAEVIHVRDQAALTSALAEARKREDNLKKALGVEKECVADIERALHEMRADSAEGKVAAESKLAEARSMLDDAQRKYLEAEAKLRGAESLQDESRRRERAAERKLQEVEAREDDLRRRIVSFKSDCDAKEKENMLDRQSLVERQKVLSEAQNKLLDGQTLLNQREADILSKSHGLRQVEKELEAEKEIITVERKALMEQKSNLELSTFSLTERETAVTERELLLNKKEQELLVSLEKFASKEHDEVQRLIAKQETLLNRRRIEFEADLLQKQKVVEEDIETKRRAWELTELDLKQREDLMLEKEQDLEVQSRVIADKGNDLSEKMKSLEERERHLKKCEEEVELTKSILLKEREEIDQDKMLLEKSLLSLERDRKKISTAETELEHKKTETSQLRIWETKLKDEIDIIREQKLQLEAEGERLKVEKSKFETEWEFIDEKREELKREEECIAGERLTISKFLKDERESLNLEKVALREQYKRDLELLSHDQEAFRSESQHERSEWFSKFQQERADFLLDIECRKRELEDCVNKKREDTERYLQEKEKTIEEEKRKELQYISSLKEDLVREQERVACELKKLEVEKLEIKLDREQRDRAWAELQSLIEELQMQRMKLKELRVLLHADREEIHSQIERLKKLEDLKVDSDKIVVPAVQQTCTEFTPQVIIRVPQLESAEKVTSAEVRYEIEGDSPPSSAVSWLKKCASLIFKSSPENATAKHVELPLGFECENRNVGSVEKEAIEAASEEPKVIHEVPTGEDETDICDLEATKYVPQSSMPASSKTAAGRKKRVHDPSEPGIDSALSNDGKSRKKRRQQDADTSDDSQEVTLQCVELKPPSKDQNVISSSMQSEISKEKAVGWQNEVDGDSGITFKIQVTGEHRTEFLQSEVEGNETLRCIIVDQTPVQEVAAVIQGEELNRYQEETVASELEEGEVPLDNKLDMPEMVQRRVRTRSKSKQKA